MLHRDKSTITSALFSPAEQFSSDRPAVEPDFNACTVFLFFPFFIRRPKDLLLHMLSNPHLVVK